jgi:hypothetical protein
MDPIEARHLFPIMDRYIHMNHAGVTPMSQRVQAAIEQVVDASVNRPYRDHWAQDEADLTPAPTARRFEESVVSLLDTAAFGAALEWLFWHRVVSQARYDRYRCAARLERGRRDREGTSRFRAALAAFLQHGRGGGSSA